MVSACHHPLHPIQRLHKHHPQPQGSRMQVLVVYVSHDQECWQWWGHHVATQANSAGIPSHEWTSVECLTRIQSKTSTSDPGCFQLQLATLVDIWKEAMFHMQSVAQWEGNSRCQISVLQCEQQCVTWPIRLAKGLPIVPLQLVWGGRFARSPEVYDWIISIKTHGLVWMDMPEDPYTEIIRGRLNEQAKKTFLL